MAAPVLSPLATATIADGELADLRDPQLRRVADHIFRTAQIAAEKVVANHVDPGSYPLPADPKSFEQLFLKRFSRLKPAGQQAAVSKLLPRVRASEAERRRIYGDLARVDLRAAMPVDRQPAATISPLLRIDPDDLQRLRLGSLAAASVARTPAAAARVATPVTDKLEFLISHVRCIGETGNGIEEILGGADEIDLGGTTVDETGDTHRIAPFRVGEFEEGQFVRYNPLRRFTDFSLREGGENWPKHYYVTLVLAEIDFGGVGDYIADLYDRIKDQVTTALAKLGSSLLGAIGEVIGNVLGRIIGWIIDAFRDDIFPPRTLHLAVHSLTSRFQGGREESPQREVHFIGHEGEYSLAYRWRKFA
jgi:hypothetical protein